MPDAYTRLCTTLGLGAPTEKPRPVRGGMLHQSWRVNTAKGSYLFKKLQRAITKQDGALDRYRASERLAASLAKHGVSAVGALAKKGEPVQTDAGHHWLVFPWVEGEAIAPRDVAKTHTYRIGRELYAIHASAQALEGLGVVEEPFVPEATWTGLTRTAASSGAPWTTDLATTRGAMREVNAQAETAARSWTRPAVASHRELAPGNVLWTAAGEPVLIDWEAAGWIHPEFEVVRAAFEWSEDGHGVLDHARFTALLKGYREAGGTLTERASLLVDAALGSRLPWVAYSMRRALGEEGKKPDKRERAHEEAMHALGAWRRLVSQRGDCLSWVRKAAG